MTTEAINNKEQCLEKAQNLSQNARNYIDILDYDLDKLIFENEQVLANIKRVAIESRRARIRILLHRAERVIKEGHRIVALLERMSSCVELRVLSWEDIEQVYKNILLVDVSSFYETTNYHPISGKVVYSDRKAALETEKWFENFWYRASRPLDILRLHI